MSEELASFSKDQFSFEITDLSLPYQSLSMETLEFGLDYSCFMCYLDGFAIRFGDTIQNY